MRLFFLSLVRFEQLNTTQKLGIFKFLFPFSHCYYPFQSIFSLLAHFLLDRCFKLSSIMAQKTFAWERRDLWLSIGTENMLSEYQLIILMAGLPDKVSLPVQNNLRTPLLLVLYHNGSVPLDHGDWSNGCVPVSSRNPERHARIITLSTEA